MNYRDFAVGVAREAGEIARNHFKSGVKKEWKKDSTPITIADREINQLVIDEIQKKYPDHSIVAEEGSAKKKSEYVWVCDPIDGTVPFSAGYPTFAFSLALTKNGESILGVIYDPVMDRMAVAEKYKGTFINGERVHVSDTKILKSSYINLDTDLKLPQIRQPLIDEWVYTITLYSGVYASMLVAAGLLDAQIYEYQKPWDAAAVKIVVEEAGGVVTDIFGKDQRYDRKTNGFLATNGHLHEKILQLIKESQ